MFTALPACSHHLFSFVVLLDEKKMMNVAGKEAEGNKSRSGTLPPRDPFS